MEENSDIEEEYYGSGSFFTTKPDVHALPEWDEIKHFHSGVWNSLWTAVWHGRKVMLKSLLSKYADSIPHKTQLRKEYEISRTLSHPCITMVLGFEHVPGIGDCIVSEFLDGYTLKSKIAEGGYSKHEALDWATQLCEAVGYLHSMGIVHRDLKPSNIILTMNGTQLKVIDFGVSDSSNFRTGKSPMGTLRYAAPEQLNPGAAATPASDIYSIGKILEELLAPFGTRYKRCIKRCKASDPTQRPAKASDIPVMLKSAKRLSVATFITIIVFVSALAYVLFSLFYSTQEVNNSNTKQTEPTPHTIQDPAITPPTQEATGSDTANLLKSDPETSSDTGNPENTNTSETTHPTPLQEEEDIPVFDIDNYTLKPVDPNWRSKYVSDGELFNIGVMKNGMTYDIRIINGDTVICNYSYLGTYRQLQGKNKRGQLLNYKLLPDGQLYEERLLNGDTVKYTLDFEGIRKRHSKRRATP